MSSPGLDGSGSVPPFETPATPLLRRAALAFLLYAALTAALTWPYAGDPSRLAIPTDDVLGGCWLLAWTVHQASRDPARLFEANTFYPRESTLAFTQAFVPQALQAAPFLLAGGSPLLAHNAVVLLSFPLAALGAFLLARELSGSDAAAVLAGLLYAFSPYRFGEVANIHVLSGQWLPFAVFFLLRALREPRAADLVGLALCSLLQALSSPYYTFLLAVTLALVLAVRGPGALRRRTLAPVAVSLAAAAALAALAFLPNQAVLADEARRRGAPLVRTLGELAGWSASWSSYLNPGVYAWLPHQRLLAGFTRYPPLALPVVALVLAGVAAVRAPRRAETRLAAILAAAGLWLSLGPDIALGPWTLPGAWRLLRYLPSVGMLRAPERMAMLAVLGAGLLAAIGAADLQRRWPRSRWLVPALAVLLLAELYPAGLGDRFRVVPPPPPTADWLARAEPGPVLDLPWDNETLTLGGHYAYWSTRHWNRIVGGWGGFIPNESVGLGLVGRHFPGPWATRRLRDAGVRWVVVHTDRVRAPQRDRLLSAGTLPEGVRLAVAIGPHRVYEISTRERSEEAP